MFCKAVVVSIVLIRHQGRSTGTKVSTGNQFILAVVVESTDPTVWQTSFYPSGVSHGPRMNVVLLRAHRVAFSSAKGGDEVMRMSHVASTIEDTVAAAQTQSQRIIAHGQWA